MSTKHVRTAADLIRFKTALQVKCGRCGNARTLSGFEVARDFGTIELPSIQGRLRCSLCGAKSAMLTVLSPPAGSELAGALVAILCRKPLRQDLGDFIFRPEIVTPDVATLG